MILDVRVKEVDTKYTPSIRLKGTARVKSPWGGNMVQQQGTVHRATAGTASGGDPLGGNN